MPYITKKERKAYDKYIKDIATAVPRNIHRPGHMNYIITKLLMRVYLEHGEGRYHDHNELMGVLECVKQEFYRRHTAPYEDIKIKEEGDL